MPRYEWTAEHPLVRLTLARVREFEFFQLLHLVDAIAPNSAAIGRHGPAADEAVRLRPALSLGFPPGDLAEAEWLDRTTDERGRLLLTATFLGLYGSDSPLPAHFTEALLDEQEEDERVRGFLDLFHHRIYSLLFRVWKKYRYHVTFTRDGRDPISQIVRGLLGIGTADLDKELKLDPLQLFPYVGLLSQRPRSASNLAGQLAAFFEGVDFDIEQCVGRWVWIQPNDHNSLGVEKCTLGRNFLVGERIFDRSGKFRVKIGPVGFEDYLRFLPDGKAAEDVGELVHFFCDDPLQHDVELTLRGDEVPETPLGADERLGQLSWTGWLKSKPCEDKSVVFEAAHGGN
jgi:type VI secretion system protein ImpH